MGLKLVSALQSFGWVVAGGVPIIIMLALVQIFAFWTNDFQFGLRLRLDKMDDVQKCNNNCTCIKIHDDFSFQK